MSTYIKLLTLQLGSKKRLLPSPSIQSMSLDADQLFIGLTSFKRLILTQYVKSYSKITAVSHFGLTFCARLARHHLAKLLKINVSILLCHCILNSIFSFISILISLPQRNDISTMILQPSCPSHSYGSAFDSLCSLSNDRVEHSSSQLASVFV